MSTGQQKGSEGHGPSSGRLRRLARLPPTSASRRHDLDCFARFDRGRGAPGQDLHPSVAAAHQVAAELARFAPQHARIGDGARLVNAAGVEEADGEGYFIRDGVIIVPKDGIIAPGTVV